MRGWKKHMMEVGLTSETQEAKPHGGGKKTTHEKITSACRAVILFRIKFNKDRTICQNRELKMKGIILQG